MYGYNRMNKKITKFKKEEFNDYDYIELMNKAFSLDYLIKWNWERQ